MPLWVNRRSLTRQHHHVRERVVMTKACIIVALSWFSPDCHWQTNPVFHLEQSRPVGRQTGSIVGQNGFD